jgi:hypothetical protein
MQMRENWPAADPVAGRITDARRRAAQYLLGRRSPTGGFCYYRSAYLDEPNLFDTCHAAAALALLRVPLPAHESTAAFVVGHEVEAQPYALYYRTFALAALGRDDPARAQVEHKVRALAVEPPDPTRGNLSARLSRLTMVLRLKAHFGLGFPADAMRPALDELEHPEGGFGETPNLQDTRLALTLLALCGARAGERTRAFVGRLALPGYGFRLTADSLSPALDTVCAGIACCMLLGLPVAHAEDAKSFILACQTAHGGFARAPDALPDIGLTHLALCGLAALQDGDGRFLACDD